MNELWFAVLELNWPVLAVVLAIVIPVTILVVVGLLAFGLYVMTRIPPIRWVFVTLLDAATLPMRRWAEDTIDTKLAPLNQLVEWDALGKFAEMLSDQQRLVQDFLRLEGKTEIATETALRAEDAAKRAMQDVDELTRLLNERQEEQQQ